MNTLLSPIEQVDHPPLLSPHKAHPPKKNKNGSVKDNFKLMLDKARSLDIGNQLVKSSKCMRLVWVQGSTPQPWRLGVDYGRG